MAKNTPTGMVSTGFQVMTLSNSTAVAINSTVGAGKVFCFSVETNNARMRADGTSPALTTGVLFQKDQTHWLLDVKGTTVKFQRQTGTCKVSIQGWKYKGE